MCFQKQIRMNTSWFDKIFEKMLQATYGCAISDQFLGMGTVLQSFTSKVHDSQYYFLDYLVIILKSLPAPDEPTVEPPTTWWPWWLLVISGE